MTIRELLSQIHSILAEDTERYDIPVVLNLNAYGFKQLLIIDKVEFDNIGTPHIVLRLKGD